MTVQVEWEHTNLTQEAAELQLLHKVFGYWMTLNISHCQACVCESILEEYWFDYSENCTNVSCTFARGGISSGEYFFATVYAINVAGPAPNVTEGLRFVVVPTADMMVMYYELRDTNTSAAPQAMLTWYPPSETGYGDNVSVPIDGYRMEIASCETFEGDENTSSCLLFDDVVLPPADENGTSMPFEYPFMYIVTADLRQGFPYWYRITPVNFFGYANTSFIMEQVFITITFIPPTVDALSGELPLPVAVVDDETVHIWQGETFDTSVLLMILGFPELREAESLAIDVVLGNWSSSNSTAAILFSNVPEGTILSLTLPAPPASDIEGCISESCDAIGIFECIPMPTKVAFFGVRYFKYADMVLQLVSPSMGAIVGGNVIQLLFSDHIGPQTRQGAGLPNLESVASGGMSGDVWFVLDGNRLNSTSFSLTSVTSSSADDVSMRDYIATITVPESPTFLEGYADMELHIDGVMMRVIQSQARLIFQYVGSEILYITPPSGMLNPGSGGLIMTVVIANVPDVDIFITVEDIPCEFISRVRMRTPVGTQTAIECRAAELDTSFAPVVNVSAYIPEQDKNLTFAWQYMLPPLPEVSTESMIVEGIRQPWVPSGPSSYQVVISLKNVAPTYGITPESVRFIFFSDDGRVTNVSATFIQVALDVRCTFFTPNIQGFTSPGTRTVTAEVCHTKGCMIVNTTTEDATWTVEYLDTSTPGIPAQAPAYGPGTGRALLVMGITGTKGDVLTGVVTSTIGGSPAMIYGIIPLEDWESQGPAYTNLLSIPVVSSKLASISDAATIEIREAIATTRKQALRSLDAVSAGQQTAIVVLQTPPFAGNFTDGFSTPQEVVVTIRARGAANTTRVSSTFLYTEPPSGPAVASGLTQNSDSRAGLDGGIRLTITVQNFSIIYSPSDIVANFMFSAGVKRADVIRMRYSTFFETKFDVIVPKPFRPEEIRIEVFALFRTFVRGSFSFTFFDDRMPAILLFDPFLHYNTGDSVMKATVTRLQDIPQSMIRIDFQNSQGAIKSMFPTSVVSAPFDGEGAVTLTFKTPGPPWGASPSGPLGNVQFYVFDVVNQKRSAAAVIQMRAIPSTPPVVLSILPVQAANDGTTLVAVKLQNMLMVTDINTINVEVNLGTQSPIITTSTPNNGLAVTSTMAQTAVSFYVPDLIFSGVAIVRMWVTGREALNCTFSLDVVDVKSASVAYALPASGKASVSSLVDVRVLRFATTVPQSSTISNVFVSTSSFTTIATLDSARVLGDGLSALVRISMSKIAGNLIPENVQVTVKFCTGSCPSKTVQFPFFFRSPFAPFILFYSPLQTFTDGRVLLNLTMENLDASVGPSNVSIPFGDVNASSITVDRYDHLNPTTAVVTAVIPTAPAPGTLTPMLVILGENGSTAIQFPSEFEYIEAPNPVIASVSPMAADVTVSSPVKILLRRFPGITANSDIVVQVSRLPTSFSRPVALFVCMVRERLCVILIF
jgi:hypothetical protein